MNINPVHLPALRALKCVFDALLFVNMRLKVREYMESGLTLLAFKALLLRIEECTAIGYVGDQLWLRMTDECKCC